MNEKMPAMMDRIRITDVRALCIIGLNDWERTKKQEVIINICLYADLSKPAESDDVGDAIDYKEMKKQVVETVEKSRLKLIEALAGKIVRICLSHPAVRAVRVRVDKPGALRYARTVSVELLRMK